MGKGDKPRPVDRAKYDKGWTIIRGGGPPTATPCPKCGSKFLRTTYGKTAIVLSCGSCKHEISRRER